MTTLDGVERHLRHATPCWSATATGRPASPGSWAARSPRSATRPPGSCSRSRPGTGSTSCAPRASSALRSDASNRNEKQLHPELALRAQRVASQLLVELCGARLVPGTIDVTGEIPDAHRLRLRGGRAERVLGLEIPFDESGRVPAPARVRGRRPTAPTSRRRCPFHRHYDVTREIDLVEEVGRIHGYAEHLPLDAAAGERRGRAAEPRAAAAPPRRGPRPATSASTGSSPSASPTPGSRSGCGSRPTTRARATIAISNPLSSEHSVLRTTLLGGLLDVARYNLAHGARGVALYESGRAYLREGEPVGGGTLGGSFPGQRPAPAFEPWRIACLASGALPGGAGGAMSSSPTSTRSRACSRASPPGSAARSRSRRPRSRS